MRNQNKLSESPEYDQAGIEAFMPLERIKYMTQAVLQDAGRINGNGEVQPIEVKRRLHDAKWLMGPEVDSVWRADIFVPDKNQTKREVVTDKNGMVTENRVFCPNFSSILYNRLTGRQKISVSYDQALEIHHDRQQLEATLSSLPSFDWDYADHQLEDSYQVRLKNKAEPQFAQTRVYVPGGLQALQIANAVFESGADMEFSKIWTPLPATGEQTVRYDAPIFGAVTHGQLYSIINSLKRLKSAGLLPSDPSLAIAGYEVAGLPGVYVGQHKSNDSFNSRMDDLFAGPIREAASEVKLQAGDIVEDTILSGIAAQARRLAFSHAADLGFDSTNHAFLKDQPVADIIETIRQA